MCIFLFYSDNGSNKDFPGTFNAYGEEPFKSGIGTFHPPPDDACSIKSDKVADDDLNSQPLHPPNTYDKLQPKKVRCFIIRITNCCQEKIYKLLISQSLAGNVLWMGYFYLNT